MIGEDIEVTVLAVEGDTVKIGIRAPRDVQLYRTEIYEAIRQSNQEAAKQTLDSNAMKDWFRKKT